MSRRRQYSNDDVNRIYNIVKDANGISQSDIRKEQRLRNLAIALCELDEETVNKMASVARDAFKDADDVEYASCVEATAIYTIESERNIAIQQITKPVPLQFKNNLEVLAHFIGSPNGSNLYGYMKHIPLSEDTKAGAVRDLYCELLFMLMPYGIEPYGYPKNTEIKPYEGPRDKQHRIVHNKDHFYFLHYNDPYVVGQCLFFAMLRSLFYANYSGQWENDIWRILNCRDLREMGIEIYDFYSSNMESARESIEDYGLLGCTDKEAQKQLTFANVYLANHFFTNTGFPKELCSTVKEDLLDQDLPPNN